MTISAETIMAGIAILGMIGSTGTGVVWAIKQSGRIDAHDQLFTEREKLEQVQFGDLKDRLQRIEAKIDQGFNGRLKGA